MDTVRLLARCRDGDELAWEALVRRFQARIYGLALHYLGDAEEARDIAQEVFVRVYERLDDVRDAGRFVPWIVRIARNAALDRVRRRAARPPAADVPVEWVEDVLAAGSPSPEEIWRSDRRKALVHRAIGALGAASRDVLVLREMQGLSEKETAEILEIPVGTVKSRMNSARIELARRVLAMSGGQEAEA